VINLIRCPKAGRRAGSKPEPCDTPSEPFAGASIVTAGQKVFDIRTGGAQFCKDQRDYDNGKRRGLDRQATRVIGRQVPRKMLTQSNGILASVQLVERLFLGLDKVDGSVRHGSGALSPIVEGRRVKG